MSREYHDFLDHLTKNIDAQINNSLGCFQSGNFKTRLLNYLQDLVVSSYDSSDEEAKFTREKRYDLLIALLAIRALNITYDKSCWFENSNEFDLLLKRAINNILPFIDSRYLSDKNFITLEIIQYNTNNIADSRHDGVMTGNEPFNPVWRQCVYDVRARNMTRYFSDASQQVVDDVFIALDHINKQFITSAAVAFFKSNSDSPFKESILDIIPSIADFMGVKSEAKTAMQKYANEFTRTKFFKNEIKDMKLPLEKNIISVRKLSG